MALDPILTDGSETGKTIADKVNLGFAQTDQNEQDIITLQDFNTIKLTPQVSPPSYQEGQLYYDEECGTLDVQGRYDDVTLQVGREQQMEVINNSGSIIANGKPVRHNGVSAGFPQIELAQADTFTHAIILGMTTHEIGIGEKGIVTTFGIVADIDTSLLLLGAPIFLSDTVAGGLTSVAPDIATQVGGVLTLDASSGKFFVSVINNITLPTVLGLLQNQTGSGVYNLTATPQDLLNYDKEGSILMAVDKLLGTIDIPADGFYQGTFTAGISFPSATSTRTIDVDIFEENGSALVNSFPFNVPRDATEAGISFTAKFEAFQNQKYIMQLSSTPNMTITFLGVSMDINSVRI